MPDIAEYGVRIKAPEGVDQTVSGFKKIEDASKRTTSAVDKHNGAFERSASALAKHSVGAMAVLRTLGPLGGEAVMLAERLERAAVRAERLAVTAAQSASQQKILESAFKSGSIAAATMEAAQNRLMAARQRAISVEQAYARATAASRIAQEEARIAASNLREQRLTTSTAKQTATNIQAVPFWDRDLAKEQRAVATLEREQRNLNRAQADSVGTINALRATQAEERAVKQQLTNANKELAAANGLVTDASAAATSGMGATIAVVVALVAILAVLAAGIYAVHKAWEFVKESFKAASEVQSASVSLELLIKNGTAARQVFEELNSLDLRTGIGEKELLGAATQLYGIGIGVDDLVEKTKQLANVAAVLNKPIDAATSAYVRLFEMIGSTGRVSARTLTAFAQQGFDVLLVLSETTGRTREEVARMVHDGEIGIKQIDAALAAFAKNDFIGERAKTWEGIGKRIASAWEEVHEVFGRPIIDALGPILDALLGKGEELSEPLRAAIELASKLGEGIAHVINSLNLIAKEAGWQTALLAAWEYVMYAMADKTIEVLVSAFKSLAPILKEALIAGLTGGTLEFMAEFALKLGNEFASKMADAHGRMQAALDRTAVTDASRGVGAAADLSRPNLRRESLIPKPEGLGGQTDWEKYKTDLQIINDYWEEYNLIQSKAATETERTRRTIELETKTAKALSDPAQYAKDFTTIQGKWAAMEEARVKKAEATDSAIKAGNASVTDSFLRGIEKAAESWGNWQTKLSKFSEDATNRIADGFATALGDVVTGTKSAKDAFRDMAVSILEDISRMIIKMLVLQAIQYALGYIGNTGGGASAGALNVGSSLGRAKGGPIFGGSGTEDDVPIMGMAGEFMIRKDVVRNQGIENLHALNEGRAVIAKNYGNGGMVSGGSHYGANPRSLNPPWHFDAYGGAADYDFWRGNLNTSFRGGGATRGDYRPPTYEPLGDVDLPPIGDDPTIMTPPVPRPDPTPGPNYGLPRDRGAGLDGPSLFGGAGPRGEPTVQVNWIGNGSVPFWNQPPSSTVGPGNIMLGANQAGSYNSSLGTWDTIDAAGNLTRVPVPAPSSFGSGLASAGLNVVGFDATTGTTFYQDASGNTYASGPSSARETQPGGATGSGPTGGTGIAPYSNFGGVVSGQRSTVGNAAFDSHAANLMQMAFQSMLQPTNYTGNDRETMPVFYNNNVIAHASEGVVTWEKRTPENTPPAPPPIHWVMPSQAESWRLGLSYSDPVHVKANNDWIAAHNQANYAKLAEWRANVLVPWQIAHGQTPTAPPLSVTTQGGQAPAGPMGPFSADELPIFHGGGILGFEGMAQKMASGGEVAFKGQQGEGVFTRGQMAAIGAGMSQPNNVQISISVDSHDNVSTATSSARAGMNEEDWKRVGEMMKKIAQAEIQRQKRFGGENYVSRTGARN